MSEPTKDDREKAERWAELHGWKKVAFDLARFLTEAREEGRLAGRREMREEAARDVEQCAEAIKHTSHANGLGMGFLAAEGALLSAANDIRALPDTQVDGEGER